jgi:uncharacterized protein
LNRPLDVGVSELLRRPGTQREFEVVAELDGLRISSAAVPDGAEVRGRFTIEAMSDHAVTVKGDVVAPWTGECRRCLREIDGSLTARVEEIFETHPVEGDTYPLENERVDLEPLVRDAVLLALPLAPLCEATCAGPEPTAHPLGGDERAQGDPRWAALSELKFEDTAEDR